MKTFKLTAKIFAGIVLFALFAYCLDQTVNDFARAVGAGMAGATGA